MVRTIGSVSVHLFSIGSPRTIPPTLSWVSPHPRKAAGRRQLLNPQPTSLLLLPTVALPAAKATTRPPTDEMHDVHMYVRSFCDWRLCGWFVQQKAGRQSRSRAPRRPSPLTPLHSPSQNEHPHAIGYFYKTCTVPESVGPVQSPCLR